mmetsp:Transcript_25104/g.52873  ORF Transcript_25104/g.52873 Transcript_25104/m.52873 type:complete len:408 (+) Transcript_25104:76-1299(+)|eukprot:CAMPEP_0171421626 /NCGR_PEP_ID=MMETSP0881-20121228/716_1 /TAXON_ID=67004 /ORGANISM="Thalassiosira weissflogii, Strain CCMP1336" /LENGTH=407 /DNA_ID=CAMNT_0011940079 /DNA_START=48 /DNA_END=1271 /DNA_ORIENTATION=+
MNQLLLTLGRFPSRSLAAIPAARPLSLLTASPTLTPSSSRSSLLSYSQLHLHPRNEDCNFPSSRQFSTEKKKDLRESIERMKSQDQSSGSGRKDHDGPNTEEFASSNPYVEKFSGMATSFLDTLSQTWQELVASGRARDINKKIGTPVEGAGHREPNYANDDEAADKYEEYKGSKDIMVIDPEEHLSASERMMRRLKDAPIIQGILEKSNELYEQSGAQKHVEKTKQTITHIREDAAEAWETSQNPWVYRASSVYDTLTAESEFAAASRQLQKLDPEFTMENWKRDVVEHTLPKIMKLFLEGRIQELKPWLGEAVYNRLAAEVRARKKEGVQMDTNILAIMNSEILACELEGSSVNVEKGDDPIILLHFMCQQIHCVRKKKKSAKEGGGEMSEEDEDKSGRTFIEEE